MEDERTLEMEAAQGAPPEQAAQDASYPPHAGWIVAAGTAKDAAGRPVRGCAPVVESGLSEADAKARAKEVSGRAMNGETAKCTPLILADERACDAAASEDWFTAKALKERGVPFCEARDAADEGHEADGRPRAVVARVPLPAAAKAGIAAACVVVAAAIVAACVFASEPAQPAPEPEVEPAAAAEEEAALHEVSVTVKAEGVPIRTQANDPAPVAVQPTYELTDADGEVVEEGEIAVNDMTVFELEDGAYSFELLSAPVLEDGTTFELPDEPLSIEVAAEGESSFEIELSAIDAEDMTKEQLEAVADELEAAGRSDAAESAREQASSAPSVSGSADSVKRDPAPSPSGGSSSPSSGGESSSGSSSGGGGSSSGSDSSEPSEPVHVHNWVAQTEDRWVVDQAAWDEPAYTTLERCICNNCGEDITDNITEHSKADGPGGCGAWHSELIKVQTGTIHHDEVGHYETVTTGYKCSGCGAWQ